MKFNKNGKGKNLFNILVIVLVIASVASTSIVLVHSKDYSLVFSILQTVGLIVSLVVAVKQLSDSKEIARADFITELNCSFVENSSYTSLYNYLQNCLDGVCDCTDCTEEGHCTLQVEKGDISNYLTFFETMYLLIKQGAVSFEMMDDLFAYRFFLAIHSQLVQEKKLCVQPENFKNIYRLENEWLKFRRKRGKSLDGIYSQRILKDAVGENRYNELIK